MSKPTSAAPSGPCAAVGPGPRVGPRPPWVFASACRGRLAARLLPRSGSAPWFFALAPSGCL
eukprot:1731434-Alexandrium_andersonii.AAC.1